MITYRLLPASEWEKLLPILNIEFPGYVLPAPEMSTVAVAEDGDKVVGMWFLQLCAHMEPAAIDPEYSRQVSLKQLQTTLFEGLSHAVGMEYYISVTDARLAKVLESNGYKYVGQTYASSIPAPKDGN